MPRQTRKQRRNPAKEPDANNLPKHPQPDHGRRRGQRSVPAGHRTVSYLARLTLRENVSKALDRRAASVSGRRRTDPASTCFSLLREIYYYSIVASKNIFKKHATGDTPPLHAMPTEIFHRIPIGVSFLFHLKYTKMKLAIALLLATSAAAFTPSAQTSRSTTTQLHETKVRIAFSYPWRWLERFFEREEPLRTT